QLINDLLDVSRIIAGKMALERAPMDLVGVEQSVVDSARPTAEASGIAIAVDLPSACATLARSAKRVRIVVSDPGKGIEATRLPVIFDRFRQADSSSSTGSHTGLGLGLAIVRHLVERHGGTVRADSPDRARG